MGYAQNHQVYNTSGIFIYCCLANTCVHLERVIYLHWLVHK